MKFKLISPIFPYMENARTEFIRKQRDEYARRIDELENSGNPSDTAELERRRRRLAELDAELSKIQTGNPQLSDESVDFARDYAEFVKNIKAEKLKYAEFYKKLDRPAQATFYHSRPDNPQNGDMWTESDGGTFVQTDDGPLELHAVSTEPSVDVKLVDRSDDNPWATAMGETYTGYTGITFEPLEQPNKFADSRKVDFDELFGKPLDEATVSAYINGGNMDRNKLHEAVRRWATEQSVRNRWNAVLDSGLSMNDNNW